MRLLLEETPQLWERKSKYLWILDPGHGGMNKGLYTTAPAKMHKFPDGMTIYEGVINRQITGLMVDLLKALHIDFIVVADHVEDTPLHERVRKADSIYAKDKRAVYLSIHSNAGGGSGFEVFTSPGQTKSDALADVFIDCYKQDFPNIPFRATYADGDADKEADFYVLRKTDCPAVLVENLFFDNRKEADFLMSASGQSLIASCIVKAIKRLEGK